MKVLSIIVVLIPCVFANPIKKFANGNHIFTSSVYKEIIKKPAGNFLVSPISTEIILALTQSGAKNETAKEIRKALNLPDSQPEIEAAIQNLLPVLRQNELYTLQTANKIYISDHCTINDEFQNTAIDVFDTELENINFVQAKEAASSINEWVENRTERKITNLIKPNSLGEQIRAVLINTLYFKGNWSGPFDMSLTQNRSFYKTLKKVIYVTTMQSTKSVNLYKDNKLDAKFLELPFQGDEVTMTIILPNKKDGLQLLENNLEQVMATPNYTKQDVDIYLPKFKIGSDLDLKEILQILGVKAIFDNNLADLSGIAGKKNELAVDEILQKTYIDVNEFGVEAAAASYVELVQHMSSGSKEQFRADHPFIFYLKVRDLIIFAGRVVDPSRQK